VLVLAPPPEAVVLLREVRELEVERERPQDLGLAVERQAPDSIREPGTRRSPARGACAPGELPDALLVGEQSLAALLDEHPSERLAEEADIAPERRIGTLGPFSRSHNEPCNTVLLARGTACICGVGRL
jgi:hypothetical protein